MFLSFRPSSVRRYRAVAHLLIKHGRADLVRAADLDRALLGAEVDWDVLEGDPEGLAADLESLGPTFVKLGQLLSTRSDLLPMPYLKALARLQDDVEPIPWSVVEEVVERELQVRLSKAFSDFEREPIAAASLGQVHRASLRDGTAVAVKVQRPGIRRTILEDLEAFDAMARVIDKHTETGRRYAFRDLLEEFRRTLIRELDYRREARNMNRLSEALEDYERIVVPEPFPGLTTSRVLTMRLIHGTKVTELTDLERIDLDGAGLAEELARAYIDGVLVHGFFHADPHPGNVLVTDDRRLALIDLGMVARVDPRLREGLLRLVVAVTSGEGFEAAQLALQLGHPLDDFDEDRFRRQVADLVGVFEERAIAEVSIGRAVMELARRSAEAGLRPAPELALLGKTMLQVNEIGCQLDPDFKPNEVVGRQAHSVLRRHMLHSVSPSGLISAALEANQLVQRMPGRLNRLFQALLRNELGIKLDVFDENLLVHNLQKIANRIALGLILAALIVGAALMMRVETDFTILGYPGIAMILFLLAAACGFILVFNILFQDYWQERGMGRRRR